MFLGLLLSAPQFAFCQEKLDLHLHFEKDETHITTVTLDQTIDQSVEGKPQRLTQKLTTSYTIKVEDVDANGAATLSLHIDSQAYHAVSGSTTIDFDSAQPASIPPPAATALSALIGQGYFFTVSAESQVIRVTGLEKLGNIVASKLSGVDGPARIAAENVIHLQLSEPVVKAMLQNLLAPFPDHTVAIGESWAHTAALNASFPLTLDTTCTLKSRQNGSATIEITGHFSSPTPAPANLGQTKFSYDFQGDTHGQIQVNESTGWISSSTTTQSLAGAATTQSPLVAPQSVAVKVESSVKLVTK